MYVGTNMRRPAAAARAGQCAITPKGDASFSVLLTSEVPTSARTPSAGTPGSSATEAVNSWSSGLVVAGEGLLRVSSSCDAEGTPTPPPPKRMIAVKTIPRTVSTKICAKLRDSTAEVGDSTSDVANRSVAARTPPTKDNTPRFAR
jgi:hypothetical protein